MVFARRYTIIRLKYHKNLLRTNLLKIGCDNNRPTSRAVWDFRRKRKGSTVSREQNMVVCELYNPL